MSTSFSNLSISDRKILVAVDFGQYNTILTTNFFLSVPDSPSSRNYVLRSCLGANKEGKFMRQGKATLYLRLPILTGQPRVQSIIQQWPEATSTDEKVPT